MLYIIDITLRETAVCNKSSKSKFVNIVYTLMSKYVEFNIKELKKMVIDGNGKIGTSLPFLNVTSKESFVKPTVNEKQRKCYQIPHTSLSKATIQKLISRGKNLHISCNKSISCST